MIISKRLAPPDDQQQPGDGGLTRVTGLPGVTGQKEGKEEKKKEKKFLRVDGQTGGPTRNSTRGPHRPKKIFLQQNTCQNIHTSVAWVHDTTPVVRPCSYFRP